MEGGISVLPGVVLDLPGRVLPSIAGKIQALSLKTAVTEKKPTGKRATRRKSYCARSAGQMKKFPKAAGNPKSRLRQARKRWRCQ